MGAVPNNRVEHARGVAHSRQCASGHCQNMLCFLVTVGRLDGAQWSCCALRLKRCPT
jgi:hypothetical protein